jgi:hypothetical protein
LADTTTNPGGTFNANRQKFENGITYCDFTLSNFVGIKRRRRQSTTPELSQTTTYYPLIAIGNLDSSSKFIILNRYIYILISIGNK